MIRYFPKRVLVQDESRGDATTREILARLPGVEVLPLREDEIRQSGQAVHNAQSYSKNTLVLMRYPGKFLKPCQGAGAEVCCNYFVVSYAWNCHLECTYCVLQSYLSNEALIVCTNIEELLADVRTTLEQSPDKIFRIGTGELADSLALDHLTCHSRRLVELFSTLPNGILELKTKSNEISNLKGLAHGGHTVISWSLNSEYICNTEERKAATLQERLDSAAACQKWGYKVGFHFDPMIYYEGWEDGYRDVVRDLFRTVSPEGIAWISLGALRFPPHLRELVQKRFPQSRVPFGEFVPGHHGKLRYFRPIREEMYRKMLSWIKAEAPDVCVYLCMESRFLWEQSFENALADSRWLSDQLDLRVLPSWGNRAK